METYENNPVKEPENEKPKRKPASKGSTFLLYLHDIIYLLAVVMVLLLVFFRIVVVSGSSMKNTLVDGDYLLLLSNVFYRNPEQWKVLENDILPTLMSKTKNLKIWSAACSTGDEPYSLVMALSRHIPLNQIKIYATDIDEQVIAKAKAGIYAEKSIASVPEDLKKKYFTKNGMFYEISPEIKARVEFKKHNLLKDDYQSGWHMIVCRNVLIYFTEEAKDGIFRKYQKALAPGGVLFIGSTEQIINHKEVGFNRKNSFYYEKP